MKLMQELQDMNANRSQRVGLICPTDDGKRIDFDAWESTLIFTDANEFIDELVDLYNRFTGEELDREPDQSAKDMWDSLVEDDAWEDFLEVCWIKQNFFR